MLIPRTTSVPWPLPGVSRAAMPVRAARPAEPALMRRTSVPPEALQLEEAAAKNVWVYSCLHIIASNIGSVPLKVVRQKADGTTEDDTSETARAIIRLLERPNSQMSGNDLIEAIAFWMNLRQALIWMQWPDWPTTQPGVNGPPANLLILPAHRTVGLVDKSQRLAAWQVRDAGLTVPAWQVVRLGFYNPKDELRSLSPVSAAWQAADTDYAVELGHANFFENGMRLSGLLMPKGTVGDEAQRRVEEVMNSFTGVGNAHAVAYLPAELTFTSMVGESKDMDFGKLSATLRDKIATAHRVPRFMLGDPVDANKASARESVRMFWQNTLLPQMRDIQDKLNVHLMPHFGDPELALAFDLSRVEALADNREEFTASLSSVSTALKQLADSGFVGRAEGRQVLREKFNLPLDVVADEEISQDVPIEPEPVPAAAVASPQRVVRELKNAALNRLRLGLDALPRRGTQRMIERLGATPERARALSEKLTVDLAGVDDPQALAGYFDRLETRLTVQ